MRKPRLRSIMICDDVRTEDNNKKLILGVYGAQIISFTRPGVMGLNLFTEFDRCEEGGQLEIDVSGVTTIRVPFRWGKGHDRLNFGVALRIYLTQPGKLVAKWRSTPGAWSEAFEWGVTFAEDAPPLDIPEEVLRLISSQPELPK